MKIGLLSDVHANYPALSAVLTDLPAVQHLLHAGDLVGYCPYPNEVITSFEGRGIDSILGNHDLALLSGEYDFPPHATTVIEWTRERISADSLEFLKNLPTSQSRRIDGVSIRIVHGSPRDPNEYVYPEMVSRDLTVNEDVLLYGHTHYPLVTSLGDCLVVNPGSVGQPRDGSARASYMILDTETMEVDHHRCEYDIETVKHRVAEYNLPDIGKTLQS